MIETLLADGDVSQADKDLLGRGNIVRLDAKNDGNTDWFGPIDDGSGA